LSLIYHIDIVPFFFLLFSNIQAVLHEYLEKEEKKGKKSLYTAVLLEYLSTSSIMNF
jgi:hypothetical protein